jgi:glycosyltransferase involved in cell wall biosynthesis
VRVRVATLIWRDGYGGAERSVRDLAFALDRDQFDMRFYLLAGSRGPFAEEVVDSGYTVENLYWRNGFSVAGRWRLLQALRRFDPMIVHDHIIPPLTRPLVKLVCRCPILHTEHGRAMRHVVSRGGGRRLIESFDLRFCDAVLANSYASQDAVQQVYPLAGSKVRVLYLGIDLRRFIPVGGPMTDETRRRIGFVGRISNDHKGTDYLPRLARLLLDLGCRNIEFVVVGDGPDRAAVEQLCEQMRVSHLFVFLGFRSDIPSLMNTFDLFLMPSRFEPFGLSALEALAMGVRVVGFDVGGLREAVGECDAAYLVSPGDVGAMARTIVSVLDLPHIRSQSSRTYVEARFSSQRMASDVQQVYREYAS